MAEQYPCISQGWTPPRTFLVFWVFLFMLLSAAYPPITLSFKAQWQFSWGRPQARLQLVPMGQDRCLSGLGLTSKLPPLLHHCLALPWDQQASQPGDASSYPFSCRIELGCVVAEPELWALEATKQEIPAPSPSFPSFSPPAYVHLRFRNQPLTALPLPQPCSLLRGPATGSWKGGCSAWWNGMRPGFKCCSAATLHKPPFGALASSCNSLFVPQPLFITNRGQ